MRLADMCNQRPGLLSSRAPPAQPRRVRGAASQSSSQLSAPIPAGTVPPARTKTTFHDANFPVDAEGRTYHLGTLKGEVANRILSVGTSQRAELLSTLLDPPAPGRPLFRLLSGRGFLTITGRFGGVPVSIVSTHMGAPNMDFVVRENRAVVDGQMAVVRLGTCGAVQPPAKIGDLLVASQGSIWIRRDPDAWAPDDSHDSAATVGSNHSSGSGNGSGHDMPSQLPPYHFSRVVPSDAALAALLCDEAERRVGRGNVVRGLNASADSFYSSQGRTGPQFNDRNEHLIPQLLAQYPGAISLEMETFQLLDLARCSQGSMRAVGMCVALAERYNNTFIEASRLEPLELLGGSAALAALARAELSDDASTLPTGYHDQPRPAVWAL